MVTAALLLLSVLLMAWAWRTWLLAAKVDAGSGNTESLADQIDALLPQTQCGQCGFPGCRPYAEAIARGEATINRCAPGGARVIEKLATLLDQAVVPLDPAHGHETPPEVAFIHEDACIGCTKCIDACPVDAIIGASKLMHTVMSDVCTGCGLCVPACPVDCIDMLVSQAGVGTADSPSSP